MPFFGGGVASAGIGGSTGATDNAILRADGTGGATLQDSAVVVDDAATPISCTGIAATDVITAVGHTFTANQGVTFPTLTGGAPLSSTTVYFVRDISGDTFKVSTSAGGSAVNLTTDLTAGTVVAVQANVAIVNNHSESNSALVLTPKGTGAFIVGPKPDGTSTGGDPRGTNSICIRAGGRGAANQVASGVSSIAIGTTARASQAGCIAFGSATATGNGHAIAIGSQSVASSNRSLAVGYQSSCSGALAAAIGDNAVASAAYAVAMVGSTANLQAMFSSRPYNAVYWGGSTTDATATTLNLDAESTTTRFTIAANTAIMADLFIIARRSDTVDKWFSSRRMVAIRRNNANGTAIIGSVQTIGADQTEGSPTWSVAITADDTNEALQVQVTGAASETVQWRVLALYRVV